MAQLHQTSYRAHVTRRRLALVFFDDDAVTAASLCDRANQKAAARRA